LDDLGAEGIGSVMVEGGARVAQNFLDENLVDRIVLFTSERIVGPNGIASPITLAHMPDEFTLISEVVLGPDIRRDYKKA
jgi:diaminohydroxyphosphoribosylaminopyrimidine deaminase / 5-amino-6-(5-phosphoribosylamino)uracil reductase